MLDKQNNPQHLLDMVIKNYRQGKCIENRNMLAIIQLEIKKADYFAARKLGQDLRIFLGLSLLNLGDDKNAANYLREAIYCLTSTSANFTEKRIMINALINSIEIETIKLSCEEEKDIERTITKADDLRKNHEFKSAAETYKACLKKKPVDHELYFKLFELHKNWNTSESRFYLQLWQWIACIAIDIKKTTSYIQEKVDSNPNNPFNYFMANMYYQLAIDYSKLVDKEDDAKIYFTKLQVTHNNLLNKLKKPEFIKLVTNLSSDVQTEYKRFMANEYQKTILDTKSAAETVKLIKSRQLPANLTNHEAEPAKNMYEAVVQACKMNLDVILDPQKLKETGNFYPDIYYYIGLIHLNKKRIDDAKKAFDEGLFLDKGKNFLTADEKCKIIRCMTNCPDNFESKITKLNKEQALEKANSLIKKKKYLAAKKIYENYLYHFPLDNEVRYLKICHDENYTDGISAIHCEIYQWCVRTSGEFINKINQLKENFKKDPNNPAIYRELADHYFYFLFKDHPLSDDNLTYCIEFLDLHKDFLQKIKDQDSIFFQNLLKDPLNRKIIKIISTTYNNYFHLLEEFPHHPKLKAYFNCQHEEKLKIQFKDLENAKKEYLNTPAKPPADKDNQKKLKLAIKLFKQDKIKESMEILEDLINSNIPLVGIYLALCYVKIDKPAYAEDLFCHALELANTSNNAIIDLKYREELLDILIDKRLSIIQHFNDEKQKIVYAEDFSKKARAAIIGKDYIKALFSFHEALTANPKMTRKELADKPLELNFIEEIKLTIKKHKEKGEYQKALRLNSDLLDLTPLDANLYFTFSELTFLSYNENCIFHLLAWTWLLGEKYKEKSSQDIFLLSLDELIDKTRPGNIESYLAVLKHICALLHLARISYFRNTNDFYVIALIALEKCSEIKKTEEFKKALQQLASKQLELLQHWLNTEVPKKSAQITVAVADIKTETVSTTPASITPPSVPLPLAAQPVRKKKVKKKAANKVITAPAAPTTPIVIPEIKVTPTVKKNEIGLHFFEPKKIRRGRGKKTAKQLPITSAPIEIPKKESQQHSIKDTKTSLENNTKTASPVIAPPAPKLSQPLFPIETWGIYSLKNKIDVIIITLQNLLGKNIYLYGSGIHYLRNNFLNREVDDFVTEVDFAKLDEAIKKYNPAHNNEPVLLLRKTQSDLKDLTNHNKEFSKIGYMAEKNDSLQFTTIATICHNPDLSKENGMVLHAKSCDTYRNSLLVRFEYNDKTKEKIAYLYDPLKIGLLHLIHNRHELIDNSATNINADPIKILRLFYQSFREKTRPTITLQFLQTFNLPKLFASIPPQRLIDHLKKMLISIYQDESNLFYQDFDLFYKELTFLGIFQALPINMQGLVIEYSNGIPQKNKAAPLIKVGL